MPKLVQIAAAGSYALTSVLILLFNKVILSTYSFKYPFTFALSHMVMGLLLLRILKSLKFIHYAPFDWHLAKKAMPVSLCFIANCVLGMVALKGTNIPMFATLRRLTVLMVVLCEVVVLRKKQTALVVVSVTVMVIGSFIGGWGDLQFDLFGYGMVLLNNLVTALNLVFIKKTLMDTKLASDTFGVLYYNSLLSIPFLLMCTLLSGEAMRISEFPFLNDPSFQLSFVMSALMSFLMNYSTYWCTEVNSALTTSVTGQVKNVLSSFVSLSLFGGAVGVQATPMLIAGLSVGLTGSFMYAYAIFKKDQTAQKAAADKKDSKIPGSANAIALVNIETDAEGGDSGQDSPPGGGGVGALSDAQALQMHQHHMGQKEPLLAREHSAAAAEADAKLQRLEAGERSPAVHVQVQPLLVNSAYTPLGSARNQGSARNLTNGGAL